MRIAGCRLAAVLLACSISSLTAADPAAITEKARAWRSAHEQEIVAAFADLVAIPNLASDRPNIERNAAVIRALFEKRGLTVRLLELEGAPPIVVVDLPATQSKRTIVFYAHYDGQPVDPAQW